MTTIQRGTAGREGVIEAELGVVWALITDWGNMDWWGNDLEQEDMKAAHTYLEGEKGKVPRTKVIERSNSGESGAVHVNREVLIHEDPVAHRLYYTCSDGLLPHVRNYLASWSLDALSGDHCKMSISANFDLMEPGDLHFSRSTFDAVYELIFKGLNHYLSQRGGKFSPAD